MVYILGGWQTDFAQNWERQGNDIASVFSDTLDKGLTQAKLDPEDIETGHVGNFVAELFAGQGMLGGFFGQAHPALDGLPTARRIGQRRHSCRHVGNRSRAL